MLILAHWSSKEPSVCVKQGPILLTKAYEVPKLGHTLSVLEHISADSMAQGTGTNASTAVRTPVM